MLSLMLETIVVRKERRWQIGGVGLLRQRDGIVFIKDREEVAIALSDFQYKRVVWVDGGNVRQVLLTDKEIAKYMDFLSALQYRAIYSPIYHLCITIGRRARVQDDEYHLLFKVSTTNSSNQRIIGFTL